MDIFQYREIKFPENFIFGASTAGQQIDGNSHSQFDDPDIFPPSDYYQPAGIACNSYRMYRDDIELIKKLGLDAYRMSVEWSRIEPEQGLFDREATDHYVRQLNELKEAGVKICLTLYHFAHPIWFDRLGKFTDLNQMGEWKKYVEYIVPIVEPYVDYWIVINEPNLPYRYDMNERLNLLEYHAAGYQIIKKYSAKPVSTTLAYSMKMPYRGQTDMLDNALCRYSDFLENEYFLHAIRTGEICAPGFDGKYVKDVKDSCDFWAFNTYARCMVDGRKKDWLMDHPIYRASHIRSLKIPFYTDEIYPDIMINALLRMKDKPCMITENGMATEDDRFRIVYLTSMLQAIREAMDMGVEVWGYMCWSLLDNWEWGSCLPQFGIAEVEKVTYRRIPKDSGRLLGDISRTHKCSKEMIQKYLKSMPSKNDLQEEAR
ncbi:family 1 glycosylhydrolase [Ruminococcus sp. CLA-AA-H200]|uniref:Family 1 glycosylhydrolase n=1 Tax=Ruminococcus turbiniformis TaxID=2881258 RepID=A0ABS8FT98_9FIRM|nr:family 1 glycosylhydrolase [Ruminococcus turbiniformis]MCC2253272.1 family 1 glycosylhydrolase [Ruminococcus turbiniformis]